MNSMNFRKHRILKGLSTIILLSLGLVGCGAGSTVDNTPITGASTINAGIDTTLPTTNAGIETTVPTTLTLSASQNIVAYNSTSVITWSSTGSTSCTSSPTGINNIAGSFTTPQLTTTTTYTVTCVGSTGAKASKSVTITVADANTTVPVTTVPVADASSIVKAAAACAAEPMRGKVYYYCDCGTGAEAGCVAGNDANPGTSPASPRRTIGNAAARFSSLAVNDTVALCKGGAFNSTGNLSIGSNRCGAGVACNDLREYTPTTFAGTGKPIINNAAGTVSLFSFVGDGGVRLLNLKLKGDNGARGNRNRGFFLYKGTHDVTMCNLDMDAFDVAVYNESGSSADASNINIKLTGSTITNSRAMGYLGAGINDDISYNHWEGNGSSTVFDHTIYFNSRKEMSNIRFVGNVVKGQYGNTCLGGPVIGHMAVNGLLVKDNVVDVKASSSTAGCWGISFNNLTNAPEAIYHRNAVFSGNTIRNGGNTALTVSGCPGCVIENNLILNETAVEAKGIVVATKAARTSAGDDLNTGNKIRNNTIWFGPNSTAGGIGIKVGTEGSNHVISNNSVYYSARSVGTSGGFDCFSYPLSLASYAFINNNHCESAAPYSWVEGRGNLEAWKTYSGLDTSSIIGNPLFTAEGSNFTPAAASPLIAKGNTVNGSVLDITGKQRTTPPAIGAYER